MRRAAIVLLGWGLWLAVLTALQAIFAPKLIQFAIPAVASGACILTGLVLWVADRGRVADQRLRLIADTSYATATLIVGLAFALLGAGFGFWLILIGVGIAALGLGGIVREQLARGRSLRGGGSR